MSSFVKNISTLAPLKVVIMPATKIESEWEHFSFIVYNRFKTGADWIVGGLPTITNSHNHQQPTWRCSVNASTLFCRIQTNNAEVCVKHLHEKTIIFPYRDRRPPCWLLDYYRASEVTLRNMGERADIVTATKHSKTKHSYMIYRSSSLVRLICNVVICREIR